MTKGIGYFFVDVDKDADRGKGEVLFKRIDPYDVFVDPMSRDLLFRDANFIMVRKNFMNVSYVIVLPHMSVFRLKNALRNVINFPL